MFSGRHRKPLYLLPLVTAAASVLVIVGVFWASSRPPQPSPSPSGEVKPAAKVAQRAQVEGAAAECSIGRDRIGELHAATSAAMQQWRLHIDAMNQLVAGKITLDQATAFWDSTRVEGQRTMTAWEQVDQAYRERPPTCAPVPDVQSQRNEDVSDCARRSEAAATAFARARATLTHWRTHIEHMEMLRHGMMDASRAAELWKKMYRQAGPDISQYDAAYESFASSASCRV